MKVNDLLKRYESDQGDHVLHLPQRDFDALLQDVKASGKGDKLDDGKMFRVDLPHNYVTVYLIPERG